MTVRRVMGTEVEYGISVPGQPGANAMLLSSPDRERVRGRADAPTPRRARWDFEEESPLRDARGFDLRQRARPGVPGGRGRRRAGQRHPDQRRPALRRPRPPGVLDARGHQPARRRALGQGGGAGDGRGVAGAAARDARAAADPALQEQHRQQGRLVRGPRELPDGPDDAVRRDRPAPDPVLRDPAGVSPGRAGSGIGQDGRGEGFQLSQRADFFEVEVGPGDHAEAADHQHPRRAARRRRASTAGCT